MASRLTTLSGLVVYIVAFGLATGAAPTWAADISWRSIGAQTANDGSHYTGEGTAVFTTGEEAHVVFSGIIGPDSSKARGTARAESIVRFKDDSGFTLRFVSIWGEGQERNAGIFTDGTGRFAGMIGSATATSEPPTTGPKATVWIGTYELQPK